MLGKELARIAGIAIASVALNDLYQRALHMRFEQKMRQFSEKLTAEKEKEEGHMQVFSAESVNLLHLGPERVSYEPKDILTEAIQVTQENIGKLSLEFEEELFYDNSGRPFFVFSASRGKEDSPADPAELYVRLSDWIVPLRGELHIFRDVIFQNTFVFDNPRPLPRPLFPIEPHNAPDNTMMTSIEGVLPPQV